MESFLKRSSLKTALTIVAYLLILNIKGLESDAIFTSILLYIFPMLYDSMVIEKGASTGIKRFYKGVTYYNLCYVLFAVLGLTNFWYIEKEWVCINAKNLLAKHIGAFSLEWVLYLLGVSIFFVLVDNTLKNRKERRSDEMGRFR